jgi:PhnB protein
MTLMTERKPPVVTPSLILSNAPAAIDFYVRAFGAVEEQRLTDPRIGGVVVHARIRIGDSLVTLKEESAEWGDRGPKTLGGTPALFTLEVDDPDAFTARALEAGAKVIFPLADQFYGYRQGRIEDPFGFQWIVSKQLEELSVDEMNVRMATWWESQPKT